MAAYISRERFLFLQHVCAILLMCCWSFSLLCASASSADDDSYSDDSRSNQRPSSSYTYCGEQNCYALLNVSSSASSSEIRRAYYKLSLTLHPDKLKGRRSELLSKSKKERLSSDEKAESAALNDMTEEDMNNRFALISTAYEVLSDESLRSSYDYMLDHPESYYSNAYNYYRFRTARSIAHIPVWKILVGILLSSTLAHFLYWRHRYHLLRRVLSADPRVQYRMRANAKLYAQQISEKNGRKTASKEEIAACLKAEEEKVSEYAVITSWEGRLPRFTDLLPFYLFFYWPLGWFRRCRRAVDWYSRRFRRIPYSAEEEIYLTAAALNLLPLQKFECIEENERKELIKKQLWKKENWEEWKKEKVIEWNTKKKNK